MATALQVPLERVLAFEGRSARDLYVEGVCAGAVLPIGAAGAPRADVHVPLAHQSALAGVLLAASLVADLIGSAPGTEVTRLNVLRPVPPVTRQPAAKDGRGICMCQDRDYIESYARIYAGRGPARVDSARRVERGAKH